MFSIEPAQTLLMGLATGLVFGFLLQRGRVTRYRVILGQFLLTDFTVLRTMLTAVVVGSAGVYAMAHLWGVALHVKGTYLLAQAVGGGIFGVGMVVLGYCPGTGVGAVGEGSRHAIVGALGMLVGAAIYAEVHPWVKSDLLPIGDLGKQTFPSLTGVPIWVFVAALVVIAPVVFALLRGRGATSDESG